MTGHISKKRIAVLGKITDGANARLNYTTLFFAIRSKYTHPAKRQRIDQEFIGPDEWRNMSKRDKIGLLYEMYDIVVEKSLWAQYKEKCDELDKIINEYGLGQVKYEDQHAFILYPTVKQQNLIARLEKKIEQAEDKHKTRLKLLTYDRYCAKCKESEIQYAACSRDTPREPLPRIPHHEWILLSPEQQRRLISEKYIEVQLWQKINRNKRLRRKERQAQRAISKHANNLTERKTNDQ